MGNIIKVAVLPIKDKELLLCRKKRIDFLITLGGKLEPGETDEECAKREVMEEAQCYVKNLNYFKTFFGPRGDELDSTIELRCYLGELQGTPIPREGDNIYGFVYINRNWEKEGHVLPSTAKKIVEFLVNENYI